MALKALIVCAVCFNLPAGVPSAACPAHQWPYQITCPPTGCTDSVCCEDPINGCSRVSMVYRSVCNPHSYWDSTKVGTTAVACCTFKANCRGHTCLAGYKPKINAATIYCNGGPSTCTNAYCCDGETTKCAGNVGVCPFSDTYWDTAKANTVVTNASAAASVCCTKRATCSDYTCPSGHYISKTNPSTIYCPTSSTSCTSALCCVVDTNKCAGRAPKICSYGSSYFWDTAKGGVIPTTPGIDCCSPKPTCNGYSCVTAGKVKIATKCSGNSSSCTDSLCCVWNPTSTCSSSFTCPDGYKFKVDATRIYCGSSGCSRTSCCDRDAAKCGGLAPNPCIGPYYLDAAKAAMTASPASACCSAYATCTGYVCAAGYKLKTTATTRYCPSTFATCTTSVCCDPDATKCAGLAVSPCTGNTYLDTAKAGNAVGTTTASAVAACCSVKSTCVGHVCAAGYTAKVWPQTIICPGSSTTCLTSACCEADTTKCGGVSPVVCMYGNLNYYWDAAKAGTTFIAKATDCCTLKAHCSAAYSVAYSSAGTVATSTVSGMSKIKPSRYMIMASLIVGLAWWQ